MFNIYLYINSAENNRVDKTSYIEQIGTYTGSLKNDTSIINPEIIIDSRYLSNIIDDNNNNVIYRHNSSYINVTFLSQYSFIKANYAYIPEFERYYFITDIVNISNDLWQFSMEIDVLMTYRVQLMDLKCFVSRNEFNYDLNMFDDRLPLKLGYNLEYIENVISSPINFYSYSEIPLDSVHCVVVQVSTDYNITHGSEKTKGASNTTNFNTCYIFTIQQLLAFANTIASPNISWIFSNPTQSLISFKIFPFDIPSAISSDNLRTMGEDVQIPVGTTLVTVPGVKYLLKYNQPCEIIFTFSKALSVIDTTIVHNKTCSAKTFIPLYGFVDIDIDMFRNSTYFITMSIKYFIDVVSGVSKVVLYETDSQNVIQQIEFDIGLDVPTGYSNASDVTRNTILSAISAFASAASLGISSGTLTAATIGSKAVNIASTYTTATLEGLKTVMAGGQAQSGYGKGVPINPRMNNNKLQPFIILFKPVTYLTDAQMLEYAHLVGRPLNLPRFLNTLHGYTEIGGCHLDNLIATETEKDKILQLFRQGILLPELT